MKYKFVPTNDSGLLDTPITHEFTGNVDIDKIDLMRIIAEGPTGTISFKADTEEEQEKLDIFIKDFIKAVGGTLDNDE